MKNTLDDFPQSVIGNSLIYNADCLEIMKLMESKSMDAIITDPPYDWDADKKNIYHKEFMRICRGAIIVFCPPENLWQPKCDQTLFWIKPISTKNTSRSYSRFVEEIQLWNGETWNAGGHWSQYTNVFTDLVDSRIHPFKKPDSMITRLIQNHTNARDTIFDGFAGSGTTIRIADLLGRNAIGCEIDPGYYKIAEKQLGI